MGNEVILNLILLTRRWNTDVYRNTVQVQAKMIVRYSITLLDFFGLRIISMTWSWRSAEAWERLRRRLSQSWSPTLEIETKDLFCFVFVFFCLVCLFVFFFKVIGGGNFFFRYISLTFFFLKMSSKSPLQVLYDWCNNNWFSALLATEPPVNQWLEHP